jgi:hypothetical protein
MELYDKYFQINDGSGDFNGKVVLIINDDNKSGYVSYCDVIDMSTTQTSKKHHIVDRIKDGRWIEVEVEFE